MITRYDDCLRWVIKPQYRPHTSLQSSTYISKLKNPTEVSRVVNMPEDFPSDLILTLLDSSMYKFNGVLHTFDSLDSFKKEKAFTRVNKARKIAKRLQMVAKAKRLTRFWTFTFYEEIPNCERMPKWNSFVSTLRNTHEALGYVGVKELHASGGLHLHVLFDQYVPFSRVIEIWKRQNCGLVVWVEYVPTDRVVAYITKYITKSIHHGVKRVLMASRSLCLHLGNWPKWLMASLLMGIVGYAKYFLDIGAILEYACIVGQKKRDILKDVVALL